MLVLNFPSNPTAECVDLDFFQHVIDIAIKHDIWVVHDLAYADIAFYGYEAPSILQAKGAKDIAVKFFSLSISYNMPGRRVGFMMRKPNIGFRIGADKIVPRLRNVYPDSGCRNSGP